LKARKSRIFLARNTDPQRLLLETDVRKIGLKPKEITNKHTIFTDLLFYDPKSKGFPLDPR